MNILGRLCSLEVLVRNSVIWNLNNEAVGGDNVQDMPIRRKRSASVEGKLNGEKAENWKDREYSEDKLTDP